MEDIIAGCKKGKYACQEELYKLLAPKMYAVCLRYTDNQDDAKDVLQEGFIKVFDKIEQYVGKGSFEGWVRKIMVNMALMRFRTKNTIEVPMEDYHQNGYKASNVNISEKLEADYLLGLIEQLPPQYKLVFNLYAIEGYSHHEISEMLGISDGTSKSNLSRARAILQQKVNNIYGFKVPEKQND